MSDQTPWRLAVLILAYAGAGSCKPDPEHPPVAVVGFHQTRIALAESPHDMEPPVADDGQIAAGRQVAVRECSSCHALDGNSKSPRPDAPPLKNALWRYDEDALATHLIEAIRVGHGDMPLFDFNVIGADALIAYLRSIRSPRDERQ